MSTRDPRPVPNYEFTTQTTNNPAGNYILNKNSDCVIKKPSWKGTETVFRPFPSICHTKPSEFWPYRIDAGGRNYFGHWIRRYDCAWGVGNPAVTFILNDPTSGDRTYSIWSTPLGILYSAIEKACKNGQGKPEWYVMRENQKDFGKMLKAPSDLYLMQGVVLRYESKNLYGSGKSPWGWGSNPPVVMMLSSGAGKTLVNMLYQEKEGYRGDPSDFEARYVHGDPVGLNNGRFIHIFEKGHDPRQKYNANPNRPSSNILFGDSSASGGGFGPQLSQTELKGYDMYLSTDLDGFPASMKEPSQVDNVRNKWRHWEDILFFPSYKEQAHILAKSFPASAIMYAFADHPDWIPEELRKKQKEVIKEIPEEARNNTPLSMDDPWSSAYAPASKHGEEMQKMSDESYMHKADEVVPMMGLDDSPFGTNEDKGPLEVDIEEENELEEYIAKIQNEKDNRN